MPPSCTVLSEHVWRASCQLVDARQDAAVHVDMLQNICTHTHTHTITDREREREEQKLKEEARGEQAYLLVECFQGIFGRRPRQLVDARQDAAVQVAQPVVEQAPLLAVQRAHNLEQRQTSHISKIIDFTVTMVQVTFVMIVSNTIRIVVLNGQCSLRPSGPQSGERGSRLYK